MANEDRAARYHRLKRRALLLSSVARVLVLLLVIVTGFSVLLRDISSVLAGGSFTLTIIVYVVGLSLFLEIVRLPLAFYEGVTLERRYGLSTQSDGHWWFGQFKSGILVLVFVAVFTVLIWHLIFLMPELWWVFTAVSLIIVLIGLVQIAPVSLIPLFYDIKPLDRPLLRERLVALAQKTGAPVFGVFEWRVSNGTRKANALLVGIGRTKRILLSDTLLADHSDDEIEVILAHELAHHVHHDIWKGVILEGVFIWAGCYLGDRVLTLAVPILQLSGKSDIAGFPIVVMAGITVSLLLVPIVNAVSRLHERRADRYALEMTRNTQAFISAMKRLGMQNLADERPSRLVQLLFHTHPPISARIAAAEVWDTSGASNFKKIKKP